MKHALSILLIAAINWHLFASVTVYVSFKINQDYIATYLCINREVPESTCKGCCQLKKELVKQQEQKQDLPQTENKKTEIQYFARPIQHIEVPSRDISVSAYFYLEITSISNPAKIFHPPRIFHA